MPAFEVVGLPDAAVKEARERVRAALKNSGLAFPAGRLTINLAPADTKKAGTVYDLPLLLGILAASGNLDPLPEDAAFFGELSLSGELCLVRRWRASHGAGDLRGAVYYRVVCPG
ncbi:MAG: magnesium chelatase domain-containing protein [Oscillospiraceae bacterium]